MQIPSFTQTGVTAPGRDAKMQAAAATAGAATIGLGTVCWVVTVQRMNGMNMGVATRLGSFLGFLALWIPMMAAMMLPGTFPSALRLIRVNGRAQDVAPYVALYLGVWATFGVVVYTLYRPHGAAAAGTLTLVAGIYELTPIKRRFRGMGHKRVASGLKLGLCCVGCNIGLMVMMVAIGVMSLTWMAPIAAVMFVQKVLPSRAAIDVPVALAIIALGIAILVAPTSVPGLVPSMHQMVPGHPMAPMHPMPSM
jgi:predicted metal-binding membrane protein